MSGMCECYETCDLFNKSVVNLPSTAKSFEEKFCKIDNESCARYVVYKQLGKNLVPTDLFPNEMGKAISIVESA